MMRALETIAARLEALASAADEQHPIDPHAVRVCAVQVRAQAEMIGADLHTSSDHERA